MTEYDLGKVVGDDGEAGNGIASITKTGTSGLVDTYTITYDNGDTDTFTVTNGSDASVTIQTSWGSTTSDSKVPSEKLTKNSLDNKLDKKLGTQPDKPLVTGENGYVELGEFGTTSGTFAEGNHTHSTYVQKSSTSGLLKNDGTVDTTSYSTFSGSYNDLSGKPTIPTKTSDLTNDGDGTNVFVKNNDSRLSDARTPTSHTHTKSQITDFPTIPSKISDLTNDSDFIETSSTAGLLKNDGTVMASGTGSSNWAVGNHTHGRLANNGQVVDSNNQPIGAKILFTDSNSQLTGGTHLFASAVNDNAAHGNLGTSAGATQADINSAIDSIIGSAISYIVGSGS